MSFKDLKDYIALCVKGESMVKERLDIILNLKEKTLKDMQKLQTILEKLDSKIEYYEKMIKESKDELNPLSKDYVKRKKRVEI